MALSLFCDHAINKARTILLGTPDHHSNAAFAQLVNAFCPAKEKEGAHMLQALRDNIDDVPSTLASLATILPLEGREQMSEQVGVVLNVTQCIFNSDIQR